MKKFIALLLSMMLFAMTSITALPADDIVDTAIDNGSFTILVQALEAAGLVETLRGDGPFTVFAPTDAAFADLLAELDVTAAELLAHPRLKEVLLYHVVAGEVESGDITEGLTTETALGLGEELTFTLVGGVFVNDSEVVLPDVFATNGVIHVIDKVLIPEAFFIEFDTVVDVALSDDNFSILVAALQAADLVGALQGAGPFTVFAPTNAAFTALLTQLDLTAEELLAQSDLAKVLLYHVVPGLVKAGDITDGLVAETLNTGNSLTFTLGSVIINGSVNVTAADLLALNGVVHVIDTVLVPANFTLDDPIPQTNDDNLMVWMGLLLVLGSGLVIIARLFNKKVTA
ncbi:MAG: fasciclin domain-containing protein [Erysipelothrix sp.]|nr:fasciclin domain-containing protein [Erysipelothrix sp.]